MAKKKQGKKKGGGGLGWVLGGLTVLGVGLAAVFLPGKASAKPKPKPEPETEPGGNVGGGGAIGGGQQAAPQTGSLNFAKAFPDEEAPFMDGFIPSDEVCSIQIAGKGTFGDGQPYNLMKFPDAKAVVRALIYLGYETPFDYDVQNAEAQIWLIGQQNQNGTVMQAQRDLRDTDVPGYAGAPPEIIEGIVGVCMLRALGFAVDRRRTGDWLRPKGG